MTTHLRPLPDPTRMLAVLFDDGQDARGDDPMGAAEVGIDLCISVSIRGGVPQASSLFCDGARKKNGIDCAIAHTPCSVSVICCSSFSNSSVSVRLR